jgi:hypothetical protein
MTAAVETPVLVVDDSAAIRTYLAKNLEELGIQPQRTPMTRCRSSRPASPP